MQSLSDDKWKEPPTHLFNTAPPLPGKLREGCGSDATGESYLLCTMGKLCDPSFPDFPFGKLNQS